LGLDYVRSLRARGEDEVVRSRDTVVSRAKFMRSARRIVYLYARPKVEMS